jgi:flagellar hook-basal body complex protein FliE
LSNPTDYLLAANQASLSTQMTVAVRNKALDAFNEIMRMPL